MFSRRQSSGKSTKPGPLKATLPQSPLLAASQTNNLSPCVKTSRNCTKSPIKTTLNEFGEDVPVLKRKRRFGGSLRIKRSDSLNLQHPTCSSPKSRDDSFLSRDDSTMSRDDNNVTRDLSRDHMSRDLSHGNSVIARFLGTPDEGSANSKKYGVGSANRKQHLSDTDSVRRPLPPELNIKAPSSHGKMSGSHGNITGDHGNMSGNHGKRTGDHGNMSGSHGKRTGDHGNMSGSHGKRTGDHSKVSGKHVNIPGNHGNMSSKHGNMSGNHGNMSGNLSGNYVTLSRDIKAVHKMPRKSHKSTSQEDDEVLVTPAIVKRANKSGYRDSDPHSEGRKWGSCSRLEYSNTPPQHHFPLSHERTDGDGGPASYNSSDLPYTNQYRRHSSSKMSSHSGSTHSDDVTLQQQLDEKNRVIDSLKMRVSEQDLRLADLRITDRALSEKSGEHGAVAESLDSGIDIRSETGGMKPLFSSTAQRTQTSNERIDQRNEISRLKLHIQQLENRFPEHVEDETEKLLCKINDLIKENREIVEEKTSINRKFSRLQDYLTTLPTVNEYNSLKERLNQLTEENKKLQEETKKTSNATKDSKQKETDLKKYQKKCNDMRDTISKLEKQNQTLKSQNASQAKQELQKLEQERSKMDKKVEALRKEISVLSEQKETAKNMVGGYYEKYNNEHETNKILTESLDRSRVELDHLQSTIDTDKDEIKALKAQVEHANTELEKCEEKLREYETKESLEPSELDYLKMLLSEFNGALQDLNNVVEVCQMYVHGERPNISLLLGLGSSPQLDDTDELSFRDKLEYVKELRSNIECLRTYLSEIYAVEVGRQCPTQ